MPDIYAPPAKVILFTGNYGSGKSEIAVNYALRLRERQEHVTIIDLDIVNPYFRCREATELLRQKDIRVIIPEGERRYADLPIIVPEVKGAIRNSPGYTILDVGGEDVGARVLSYLSEAFCDLEQYEFLVVINRNRPFTGDVAGATRIIRSVEKAAGLEATGLVSNTHLLEQTDLEMIIDGYQMCCELSRETAIPIFFVAVPQSLVASAQQQISAPLLPVRRILLPPHLQAE